MAKITVKGYIGTDAELRTVGEGEGAYSVCDFRIAENITRKNGDTRTVWYKVTLWRKYAETMAQYLKKGRKVQVEGLLDNDPKVYTGKDNTIHAYNNIQATDIDLLDAPRNDEEAPWASVEEPAEA